ncbi:MAG: ABC transporter [Rhodospirillaceae bacterium]|nr:ABC transporter [Rhodospirillaceae bacterium]OUU20476.1 MAG: ABC transporter [Candidatus Endolissoclinum sp. TMED37]
MNKEDFTISPVIEISQLSQYFQQGQTRLEILKDVSLKIMAGEMVGLVGPSGSGKSTLLHLAGLLERPSGGKIIYMGQDCELMTDHQRTKLRLHEIGFIYQFHHLLPEFSALENIIMPQLIAGLTRIEAANRANQLLNMVGLSERGDHKASQLSGGEKQRVAIVRSIANVPRLVLADEPTGNLDPLTSTQVFEQLRGVIKGGKLSAIIATHNYQLAEKLDRIFKIEGGSLVEL